MNLKKILVLLLIFTAAFTVFANGNKESTGAEGGTEVDVQTYSDGLPDKDMGGRVIKIYDYHPGNWEPEENTSEYTDHVIARNKAVEERFNCKIEVVEGDLDSLVEIVQMNIMAGDKFADIIVTTQWSFGEMLGANVLQPLTNIPTLDLSKKYWDKSMHKITTKGSSPYGTSAQFISNGFVGEHLVFNKAMIEELGLENPYELVKNKQWTWDKFFEMARAANLDVDGDGVKTENDRWGVISGYFQECFWQSSGLTYVEPKKDGGWKYIMDSPSHVEVLNKMQKEFHESLYDVPSDVASSRTLELFMEGHSLFHKTSLGGVHQYTDAPFDFGIVPFPMGPYTDEYLSFASHNSPVICIPSNVEDLEDIGIILEALGHAAQDDFQMQLEEEALMHYRDQETKEMAEIINKTSSYNIIYTLKRMNGDLKYGTYRMPKYTFYEDPNFDLAAAIAEQKERMQTILDEIWAKLK